MAYLIKNAIDNSEIKFKGSYEAVKALYESKEGIEVFEYEDNYVDAKITFTKEVYIPEYLLCKHSPAGFDADMFGEVGYNEDMPEFEEDVDEYYISEIKANFEVQYIHRLTKADIEEYGYEGLFADLKEAHANEWDKDLVGAAAFEARDAWVALRSDVDKALYNKLIEKDINGELTNKEKKILWAIGDGTFGNYTVEYYRPHMRLKKIDFGNDKK